MVLLSVVHLKIIGDRETEVNRMLILKAKSVLKVYIEDSVKGYFCCYFAILLKG